MILGRTWQSLFLYQRALRKVGLDSIDCLTIHSAKGCEAGEVFVVGLIQGSGGFPDLKAQDEVSKLIYQESKQSRLEEERRLFYVGLTRAKNNCYLLSLQERTSQFIREIPRRYIDSIGSD